MQAAPACSWGKVVQLPTPCCQREDSKIKLAGCHGWSQHQQPPLMPDWRCNPCCNSWCMAHDMPGLRPQAVVAAFQQHTSQFWHTRVTNAPGFACLSPQRIAAAPCHPHPTGSMHAAADMSAQIVGSMSAALPPQQSLGLHHGGGDWRPHHGWCLL